MFKKKTKIKSKYIKLGKSYSVLFGCDPEFFFSKNGKVLESEKVLPKKGLKAERGGRVIIDGVQAEINPKADSCRQNVAFNIKACFVELQKEIEKDRSLNVDFLNSVKFTEKELNKLSKKAKEFGCKPSFNANSKSKNKVSIVKADPNKYKHRTAGGHIHLGKIGKNSTGNSVLDNPNILVPILDILVGNTCVLMDRDKGNIERRKNYGKAGEYRMPEHGLEYRVLSNFWLRNYALMSFVMGMARFAFVIVANSTISYNYAEKLIALVDMKDIERAINTNNKALARKNFDKIKPFIIGVTTPYGITPLNSIRLPLFEKFLKQDLDYWFKEDPFNHWIRLDSGGGNSFNGWERFLDTVVKPDGVKKEVQTRGVLRMMYYGN